MTVVFGIMAFFYKYVDLTGRDDEPSPNDPSSQDESSALIVANGTGLEEQKQPHSSSPPPTYVTESEGEQIWDKSVLSGDVSRSESEF